MTDAGGKATSKRKHIVAIIVAVLLVVALAVWVPLRYMERKQAIYDGAFICYSFQMSVVSDPLMQEPFNESSVKGFFVTLFAKVEYVTEFPPEEGRWWSVYYVKPKDRYYMSGDGYKVMGTQRQIDDLNEIVAADPDIAISDKLTLPLTEEQLLSEPKAVLEIIKQLDKEQWDYFHRGLYMPTVEIHARDAGIEVPTE